MTRNRRTSRFVGLTWVVTGSCAAAVALSFAIETREAASLFFSVQLWHAIVEWLGGSIRLSATQEAEFSFAGLAARSLVAGLILWGVLGLLCVWRGQCSWPDAFTKCGRTWLWWCVPAGSWLGDLVTLYRFSEFWIISLQYTVFLGAAGWLCAVASAFAQTKIEPGASPSPALLPAAGRQRIPRVLWLAITTYIVAFTTMNWQLYEGLLLPHGDSAMYEEHLWNLLHGKGFRSYLDRGLFLGEHIQVIHVLLVPVYLIWPSHLCLELCESVALASGAIPVFWMTRRHTGSAVAGTWLAIAYLCYFPLQYMDIAIDLKTFRPMSLGIATLLFALDQLERRRYRTMTLLLLLTLSAKEDFAIIFGPLGVWLALRQRKVLMPNLQADLAASETGMGLSNDQLSEGAGFRPWAGWLLAAGSVVYVVLVTKVVLPWFRDGVEVHYVTYFNVFGSTPTEIMWNMLTKPGLLLSRLLGEHSLWYAMALLAPLGFVSIFSLGRLAVGIPLFALLSLNQLTQQQPIPWHHFHGPLIPIVFWSAAAGVANARPVMARIRGLFGRVTVMASSHECVHFSRVARWACCCSVGAGIVFGMSPLARPFWDPGSRHHWSRLYVPGKRAEMFARIVGTIPFDARVASTDFVHPRFTHHARSYDYSKYPRAVNDNKPGAPPDTDYLVIDTRHYYSDFKHVDDIPEFRDHPENWEVLPDVTEGYFIVLKRRRE